MNYNLPEFDKIDEAIEYFKTSTHEELVRFLDNEDEVLKQIALLKIDEINSILEAEKIVFTLTNHASETREYCSFLINRLMKEEKFQQFFIGEKVLNGFAKAISDVNPKVCRKIIEILPYYKDLKALYPIMLKSAFELIVQLEEKNKNKNYQYNTKSFHLYWYTFALGYTINENFATFYGKELIELLLKLFSFREYTLREKAAYLAVCMQKVSDNKQISELISKYSNDENFFVSEIFS